MKKEEFRTRNLFKQKLLTEDLTVKQIKLHDLSKELEKVALVFIVVTYMREGKATYIWN